MKYRSICNRFLMFLCLAIFMMACQYLSPGDATPTAAPELTLKPVRVTEGGLPSFIEAKGSLPNGPGTYLVYSELFSPQAGRVKYLSLNGKMRGDLLSYSSMDNWFPMPFMLSEQTIPRFVFTDYREGEVTLRDHKLNLWMTDVVGGPLYSWYLNEPDSSVRCGNPSFSPSGHWMILICLIPNQYYVNLVNMTSGEQKIISLPDVITTVPVENWSKDETRFYIWSHTNVYCFISLSNDEAVCRDVGRPILSAARDWSRFVVLKGDMEHNPDGTVPGTKISLVEMECVLNGVDCESSLDFELPFHQSVAKNSVTTPAIELRWNATGSRLAWMNHGYRDQASGDQNIPSCGWIAIPEKNNYVLCQYVETKTSLLDVSPDENWLLLSDAQGLYLLSTQEPSIQRLISPTQEFSKISFYGWLIVP